jgi:hypothetical protein
MGRPAFDVGAARAILEEWGQIAASKLPHEAEIGVAAAVRLLNSKGIEVHRSTLTKYGLTALVHDFGRRQSTAPALMGLQKSGKDYSDQLKALRVENESTIRRNRALLAQIANAVANAPALGIDLHLLWAPMVRVPQE